MTNNPIPRVVVIGTIGHINHRNSLLVASLINALNEVVVCEPEQLRDQFASDPITIQNLRVLDDPIFCRDVHRKSKGDKRRDRAERKRKGWL